jgi:hypothetical protein
MARAGAAADFDFKAYPYAARLDGLGPCGPMRGGHT